MDSENKEVNMPSTNNKETNQQACGSSDSPLIEKSESEFADTDTKEIIDSTIEKDRDWMPIDSEGAEREIVKVNGDHRWRPARGIVAENRNVESSQVQEYVWKTWIEVKDGMSFYIFGKEDPQDPGNYLYAYTDQTQIKLRSGTIPTPDSVGISDNRVFIQARTKKIEKILHFHTWKQNEPSFVGVRTPYKSLVLVEEENSPGWNIERSSSCTLQTE